MAPYRHPNFEIDEKVDQLVSAHFEQFVSDAMARCRLCQCIKDPVVRRKVAVDKLFTYKEEFKLQKKRMAAEMKKTGGEQKRKTSRMEKDCTSLLRMCLIELHEKKLEEEEVQQMDEDKRISKSAELAQNE